VAARLISQGFAKYWGTMEILLMVAVVVVTIAIVVQAGVLLSMYFMSRRVTDKVDLLMTETQRLMEPVESITRNLKTVSDDLAETGKLAHQQMLHIQQMTAEVRDIVMHTVDEARHTVMRPILQYSALASAIAEGVRTFFSRRTQTTETHTDLQQERQHPAA
jgi:flagellar basal body-associated protein FliL